MKPSTSLAARLVLFASVAVCVVWPNASTAQPSSRKTILVLHTYGSQSPFRPLFDRALQQSLNHNGFEDAEVFVETLESSRFPGSAHAELFQYYLSRKYAGREMDVVITVWDQALNYALEHRDELFPDAPLVSMVTRPRSFKSGLPISQITAGNNFFDTVKLAVELHPLTRRVVVVDGSLRSNDDVQREIMSQLAPLAPGVVVDYLRDLPMIDLIERVKALPSDSLILFIRQSLKTPTQAITPAEAFEEVLTAASVPVYAASESLVGRGVIGGVVFRNEAMAELCAEIAIRIINGTSPRDISISQVATHPTFDWRQLRKWGIGLDQLPEGSDVRFREYTFWEQNQEYVSGALIVFLLQSCLIAGLLMQRSRRRRAEGALRENEHALEASQADTRRLAGRLIAAQEVERARIARELHDDVSQKLVLLAMDIRQASLSDLPLVRGRANSMAERASEIASDLHDLSHELHPAKLQMLGLVQATQLLCSDLATRHRLDIDFVHDRIPSSVPPDPALCLFRIAQEALQNAVKHSGARNVAVKLTGTYDTLKLEVSDTGAGFDTAKLGGGMGLLSMRERVHFLDGHLTIRSKPGTGTRIAVEVPIPDAKPVVSPAAARSA